MGLRLFLFIVIITGLQLQVYSQLKVGANPTVINPNAAVEIESTNKGLLLPRLALTATNVASPTTAFVLGMFVYNTATAGTGATAVTPGIYYCDGTQWVKLAAGSSTSGSFWSLLGNASTNPTVNYIGTSDAQPLVVKTNGQEAARILADGTVSFENVPSGTLNDSILVQDNVTKVLKRVSSTTLLRGVQKKLIITAITGQIEYTTPTTITDYNKIQLYRNGVLIDFTVTGTNVITAEIPAVAGDEIRIIQIL